MCILGEKHSSENKITIFFYKSEQIFKIAKNSNFPNSTFELLGGKGVQLRSGERRYDIHIWVALLELVLLRVAVVNGITGPRVAVGKNASRGSGGSGQLQSKPWAGSWVINGWYRFGWQLYE